MEQGNNQLWLNFSAENLLYFAQNEKNKYLNIWWRNPGCVSITNEALCIKWTLHMFSLGHKMKSNIFLAMRQSRLTTNKRKASINICPRDNPIFHRLRICFSFYINSHFTILNSFHVNLTAIFMDRLQLMRCCIWLVSMKWLLFGRRMRCANA